MKIAVVGTGYVGLVTGVALSEVGHEVICVDTDSNKVESMKAGISPIYEPGLEELMLKNISQKRLTFTVDHKTGFADAEVIFIAVGTPQLPDGKANLEFIKSVCESIGRYVKNDVLVVTKSTVPVGTSELVKEIIEVNLMEDVIVKVASNPEFLREGSAVYDTFNSDRIVVGTEDKESAEILTKVYEPFNTQIFKTDIKSSEMIKYASNAFLATKISFINEISNICEKLDANIEDVSNGMGFDHRIGRAFLNAGIGYGGSCFPKDTQALVQIAGGVQHDFKLLKSVIEVNNNQQQLLVEKIKSRFETLNNKKIAILGLAFKPNTDDMRDSPAIVIVKSLLELGASVVAYDPISMNKAKEVLPSNVVYVESCAEALKNADAAAIITDWDEFKNLNLLTLVNDMKTPILFDGRNCFELESTYQAGIEYYSVGRPIINKKLLTSDMTN
ncbi:UDP-glucose dehydrogenase family protein [Priestia megaterium]|uniref:UDP-glucose dehydrogenase family protein n=1 Tax=Priestia megaterium TaxID=1404 RepID=UPI000C9A19D0|nr:UDP-glucose/GDP-mannose dehydrogenase family protein [Priestia megaterium]PNE05758.1 UDP-glucose 6-dehydrogenase [Priestia megaterium]